VVVCLYIRTFTVLHIAQRVSASLENEFIYSYAGFESKNTCNITSICMMLKLNLFSS